VWLHRGFKRLQTASFGFTGSLTQASNALNRLSGEQQLGNGHVGAVLSHKATDAGLAATWAEVAADVDGCQMLGRSLASAMPLSKCFQLPRVLFRKTSVLDRVNAQMAGFSGNHLTMYQVPYIV
jgi:hypothetical protein